MFRWLIVAAVAACRSTARLVAENLCLRKQLVVLKRRQQRPHLHDRDRRFWVVVSRCFAGWRDALLVVQPETVLRWHRKGWKACWRWRSQGRKAGGRPRISRELRELIRRMARENPLWGQQRIQAELAQLGFRVSVHGQSRNTCAGPGMAGPHQAGGDFWHNTLRSSGRATFSRFKLSGSGRCTSTS